LIQYHDYEENVELESTRITLRAQNVYLVRGWCVGSMHCYVTKLLCVSGGASMIAVQIRFWH